jgi:Zn-finger nucleic acid-binding protein
LDRGELDKIIERATGAAETAAPRAAPAPVYQQPAPQPYPPQRAHRHDDDDDDYRGGQRPRRRESFLGDLFDF